MNRILRNVMLALAIIAGVSVSMASGRIARTEQFSAASQWKSAPKFVKHDRTELKTLGITLGPSQGYDFITGHDNTQWYATATYTIDAYYYTAAEITLYNSLGEKQATLSVSVPDSVKCNQIVLGNMISSTLFDRNRNTYEVPVILHYILSPGVTAFETRVFDLESGEQLQSYDGYMTTLSSYNGYAYDYTGVLSYKSVENDESVNKYDIYNKPTIGSTEATLKHSFSIPTRLSEYQVGSIFNAYTVDGNLYYVVSQYEKEYLDSASYAEPWDMIPTEDNNFVATIYNKNFAQVEQIKVPVTSTSQYLVQYGIGLYGFDDLSINYWEETDSLNLVIASTGFEVSTENETTSFDVYNTKSEKIKNIVSNVSDWMKMYNVPNADDQMAFLASDGYSLSMVDMPSCDTVITFGATVDGNAISTNIDRYPAGDSYKYIVALADTETATDNGIIHRFAWVNPDASIDSIIRFNLGSNNAGWAPLVMGEAMNPYLFDTDATREYVFIANQYPEGTTTGNITDQLMIVKEDGTLLASWVEDASETGKGDLGTCELTGLESGSPALVIPYYNSSLQQYCLDIEYLPFAKFSAGGDGSAENPYLISSAGDLAMIASDSDAHYKVANDFSCADYGLWTAIPSFTGTLDGDNHTISDISFDGSKDVAGIFAYTEGTKISNLTIESPSVSATNASSVAIISAEAVGDTISNIVIKKATINGSAAATVGGIVANASLNTVIYDCLVGELNIDGSEFSQVGGIAGTTRTSSLIYNCAATGNIWASNTIGGIVGSTSTGCSVTDCRTECFINGLNTIGGIVGSADRGGIYRCIAQGSLSATEADWSGSYKTGGIAGSLASAWETPVANVISCNIVNLAEISSQAGGVHRIIGYSRYEEDLDAAKWDSSIVPKHETAIDSNYVVPTQLSSLPVIDTNINAEANTTEGADLAAEEFNKSFLENLGFRFGNDSQNPWVDGYVFRLYFEGDFTGIESVVETNPEITYDGNTVNAANAVSIEAYNLSGAKVAVATSTIATANLHKGVYIIVATDASGAKKTLKIAVK